MCVKVYGGKITIKNSMRENILPPILLTKFVDNGGKFEKYAISSCFPTTK